MRLSSIIYTILTMQDLFSKLKKQNPLFNLENFEKEFLGGHPQTITLFMDTFQFQNLFNV
jgi:hypothetical protein